MTSVLRDQAAAFGRRVRDRLRAEDVIWLNRSRSGFPRTSRNAGWVKPGHVGYAAPGTPRGARNSGRSDLLRHHLQLAVSTLQSLEERYPDYFVLDEVD